MTNKTERYCPTCGANNTIDAEQCFACGASLDTDDDTLDENISAANILQERYRLLSQVGTGGFSAVYKAEDLQTQKIVAVKAISLRGLSAQEKIEATDAFNREINLLSTLNQRNLPRIYDHFTDPECWYLVMDFIDGISLEHYLDNQGGNRLPLNEILDLCLLLCDVLEYLHSRQPPIIFRDLKPANIMLTRDGHIFLIDFGIARRFKPGQAHDTIPFGSPGYAAPEQYGKAQTTPRADIYSLGTILHQMITGDDPSQNAFAFAQISQQLGETERLGTLIASMVEVDQDKRPENVRLVRDELALIGKEQRGIYQGATTGGSTAGLYRPHYPPPTTPSYVSPFLSPSIPSPTTIGVAQAMAWQQAQGRPPLQAATLSIPNNYAIASLVSSLVGIFLPPFLCFAGTSLARFPLIAPSSLVTVLVVLMLPSILGVIFGHIGKQRANTIPGMQNSSDTAVTGLTIGYIFGSLYLLLALCILLTNIHPFF
jgi:serine/threonine protein kinase